MKVILINGSPHERGCTYATLSKIAGGIRFANLGSSAVDSSYATTLKLEDGEMVGMSYTTNPEEYVQMILLPVWAEMK